ncbi:hypothetical protein DFJ74DRAFT_769247 [Hyaloraphidium curvatum]|nr:hypothetical protein DFJ74DRAFT_769247 [Hyaloraphidium curvatum]
MPAGRGRLCPRIRNFGALGALRLANTALLQGEGAADGVGFAEEAARIIPEGVLAGKSRILVGHDAEELDRMAREDPDGVSGKAFARRVRERGIFGGAIGAGRKGAKI